jgi:phosphopantetheine adenylyltransferase
MFAAGQELGDEVVTDETSSLTKSQAEAVRRRVATLNATLRKKQKQREVTDIRDVFGGRKVSGLTVMQLVQWSMLWLHPQLI